MVTLVAQRAQDSTTARTRVQCMPWFDHGGLATTTVPTIPSDSVFTAATTAAAQFWQLFTEAAIRRHIMAITLWCSFQDSVSSLAVMSSRLSAPLVQSCSVTICTPMEEAPARTGKRSASATSTGRTSWWRMDLSQGSRSGYYGALLDRIAKSCGLKRIVPALTSRVEEFARSRRYPALERLG